MTKNKNDKGFQQTERTTQDSKNQDLNKQHSGDGTKNLNKDEKHPVKKEEEESYDPNHRPAKNQVDPKRKDSDMNDDDTMDNPDEKDRVKKRIDTDLNEGEMGDEEDIDEDLDVDIDEDEEEMDENGKVKKRGVITTDDPDEEADKV
ncbi:MAG: hypothetical protein IPL12_10415 [Bacteroidetes bacterium]|nr:hypothetical protein [Bacteroidota bacterium]